MRNQNQNDERIVDERCGNQIEAFGITKTLLLHLTPGVANLIVIIMLAPVMTHFGLPFAVGGWFMVLVSMVPVQFGILLVTARKTNGTYRIKELIPFREKSPIWEYLIFLAILLAWYYAVNSIVGPLESKYLRDGLFSFVPDSFALRGDVDLTLYTKATLVFVAVLGVLTDGIIAPITEESYFRGYLLPRINLPPIGAALASAALFSMYHFFSPWYFFDRLLVMVPIYYWVIRRRNIRFSILAHLTANLLATVPLLISVILT